MKMPPQQRDCTELERLPACALRPPGSRGSSRSLGSWGERELLAELGKARMCGRALLDGDGDLVLRRKASKGSADVSHPLG